MKNRAVLRVAKFYEDERPFPMLEDIELPRLKSAMFYRTGHDLGTTGAYVYKEISSDADKLSEVLNSELEHNLIMRSGVSPRAKDLRIVISQDALSIDKNEIEQDNLLLISIDKSNCGWKTDASSCCPVRLTIKCLSPELLKQIIQDVMTDIYLANSSSIWPVVKNSLADRGRKWLYREKVLFVLKEYGINTTYGIISEDCGYISFASVARLRGGNLFENTVSIWDKFVTERLKEYILQPEDIAYDLRNRGQIGGQLKSEAKLSSMIDDLLPGAWLLLFTNKYKDKEDVLNCNPDFPAARHGKISFMPIEKLNTGVHDLLREKQLIALKFYKT